jgi:beta-mannosidase
LILVAVVSAPAFAATHYYAEGRFGHALNAQFGTLAAAYRPGYAQPPFTVECWVKLRSARQPNILVSNEIRESSTHWEIFTFSTNGHFSAALPGYTPELTISERNIVDGGWHYVAMTFDGTTVRLFVDGAEAASQQVRKVNRNPETSGGLLIGRASIRALEVGPDSDPPGCSGLIEDVRVSKGLRNVSIVPQSAMVADGETLGLWSMDSGTDKEVHDLSANANSARIVRRLALDDYEREGYRAGPPPMASQPVVIQLSKAAISHPPGPASLSLDGEWQMAEAGDDAQRLTGSWDEAIPASVPGSVHTALTAAGKIPDPKFGLNDKIAHAKSFTSWWFRRDFDKPRGTTGERLVFGGCAIRCTVWLNGTILGTHEGMFGGPEFDIAKLLRAKNTLIVKIDAAPGKKELWSNSDWRRTVVFNNVWGWHYSSIPALGIWRSVRIESTPPVRLLHPFVATADAQGGVLDLSVDLQGRNARWSGRLLGTIEPDNFPGTALNLTYPVSSTTTERRIHLRLTIPSPKLWWPNDIGSQNLYRLTISFAPQNGQQADSRQVTFGIRTVEMFPQADGPRPDEYNWTFVINGRPMFVKGSNWCTMDSSMDFSRKRYDRFLGLAAMQHVQFLRAWGSGMPEMDDFYDLCDRKGIMVMQEWPTAWDSHNDQPYDMLEETVRLNTLRIRNHPSLVMYAGGNESPRPFGPAIDMMGRHSIELDGTRMFHRGEPFGGSTHTYDSWWGYAHLDFNLNITSVFFGEFGLASLPDLESVRRYLPDDEKDLWPVPPDRSFAHHTPTFNTAPEWSRGMDDMARLWKQASYFTAGATMGRFVQATQLAQATALRHTLERARTNWPHSAGALYYKINDNYPAASWSTIDWYGAPKMSYYIVKDAFSPLRACALFTSINLSGKDIEIPVFLLDDADALSNSTWAVVIRAYDSGLKTIKSDTYSGSGSIDGVRQVGTFRLGSQETKSSPLFTVVEIRRNNQLTHRSYYWSNFEQNKDCLFNLPTTTLSFKVEGTTVTLTNSGGLPAVAAHVLRPSHLDTFTADDNYFWLEPGESREIAVSDSQGLVAGAWNAGMVDAGGIRASREE